MVNRNRALVLLGAEIERLGLTVRHCRAGVVPVLEVAGAGATRVVLLAVEDLDSDLADRLAVRFWTQQPGNKPWHQGLEYLAGLRESTPVAQAAARARELLEVQP